MPGPVRINSITNTRSRLPSTVMAPTQYHEFWSTGMINDVGDWAVPPCKVWTSAPLSSTIIELLMNAWPGGRDPSLFTNPRNVSEKSQTTRPSGNTTDKAPSAPVQSSSSVLLLPYDSNIAWNALSGVTFTAGAGAWARAFGRAT